MQILDRILTVAAPHNESISTRLPRNTNPWPMAEIRASTDGHPIYGETSCNPGQTSNSAPVVLNSRSVSSHPILSTAGEKPPARPTLLTSGTITNNKHTSTTGKYKVYVPPTNTNMVNPPLSLG